MRYAALAFVFLVLVGGGFSPLLVDASGAPSDRPDGPAPGAVERAVDPPSSAVSRVDESLSDPSGTEIVIAVRKNADARWKIVTRYPLETENDTAAFRRLAERLRAGEANATTDERTFRNVVARASEATGREMAVRNVTYDDEVKNGTGVLTMSFTWTNFAEERDGQLLVGDAFESPDGGTWLPWLTADQTLVIRTPPGYEIQQSDFRARQVNESLVVDGPRRFEAGTIDVTYERALIADPGIPLELVAGLGFVVALVVAGVWLLQRRETDVPGFAEGGATIAPRETEASADGVQPGDADLDGGDEDEPEGDVDLSLLSDEERVEHILERNGGRMRQASIVQETGWSDAKVSQLLSGMADDGRVEKLRLGRENLISLPDYEAGADEGGDGDGEGD
ncbi:helix-turn-helix transcriptional regulator [Halegenticoccus soli]|uniref:helix-turn-helix transcriptional regulator n=1 Tax=Halegenticoccus soli TaxID=1985678 RepID=UPI000C6E89EC|nr:hypothetical protein [Halegenticoccus soli]